MRGRRLLIPTLLCAFVIALPAILVATQIDGLPPEVAVGWDAQGRGRTVYSPRAAILAAVLLPAGCAALLLILAALTPRLRELGALAVGLTTMTSSLMFSSIWWQRDGGTPDINITLSLSMLLGALLGLGYWWVSKRLSADQRTTAIPIGRILWQGKTPGSRAQRIAMSVIGALSLAGAVWFFAMGMWSLTLFMLVALLIVVATALPAQVILDTNAVRVRVLGTSALTVPMDHVHSAAVKDVHPLGDFGGWGRRMGLDGKSIGYVTADGPAVVVKSIVEPGSAPEPDTVISLSPADARELTTKINRLVAHAEFLPESTG